MAVYYQGSDFVKFNDFKDSKGNKLTFIKNTKNGKLFSTDIGYVTLTESQANKLNRVLKEDWDPEASYNKEVMNKFNELLPIIQKEFSSLNIETKECFGRFNMAKAYGRARFEISDTDYVYFDIRLDAGAYDKIYPYATFSVTSSKTEGTKKPTNIYGLTASDSVSTREIASYYFSVCSYDDKVKESGSFEEFITKTKDALSKYLK